jgi:hypothetical protein
MQLICKSQQNESFQKKMNYDIKKQIKFNGRNLQFVVKNRKIAVRTNVSGFHILLKTMLPKEYSRRDIEQVIKAEFESCLKEQTKPAHNCAYAENYNLNASKIREFFNIS